MNVILLLIELFICIIPTVQGKLKTAIITGANSGIGFQAAKKLASSGEWNVIFACRSKEKALKAIQSIPTDFQANTEFLELDLADLSSVRNFAKQVGNRPIDCLALNAGIQCAYTNVASRSKQGFESTIATNHIGHFHLTNLLLANVKKSKEGRIVFVASGGRLI